MQPDVSSVCLTAPAKVNLILRVLDRRPDGYHNLWSLMQTVGLGDRLSIRLNREHGEIRLRCEVPGLPTDGRNLIVKAAGALRTAAGRTDGLDIDLQKAIPMGGGLGGGSSDAATTLLAVNQVLGLNWSRAKLAELSVPLGSDVPFFLYAPTAVISGKGETVTPVTVKGSRWLVLVNPGFGVNTGWAYQRLAERRKGIRPLSPAHERMARGGTLSWDDVIPQMENDFEEALAESHPQLAELKQEIRQTGAEAALLSGSGATVFGLFVDESGARRAVSILSAVPGRAVFAVPALEGS
jgi:4-diphosphocytidyl-2-C-methyl-D-erythritol kinase